MDLLENYQIELGKDGSEIYESFDDGKTKTTLEANDLKELKLKEMNFLETVQSKKSGFSAKKEPLFSKSLEKVTSIDDDFKVNLFFLHCFLSKKTHFIYFLIFPQECSHNPFLL